MGETRTKLPSFSNEPQKFGPMTLFMKAGKLYLHSPAGMEAHISSGVSVEEMANYYERYEESETARFRPLAEAQLRHIEQYRARSDEPLELSDERREEIVKDIMRQYAARWADNCDDDHDLSAEFCESARDLGLALRDRFNAGMKTMTIIQTYKPAANFVDAPSLKF